MARQIQDPSQCFVGPFELVDHKVIIVVGQVGVVPRVLGHLVSRCRDGPHQLRVLLCPDACDVKGTRNTSFRQRVENMLSSPDVGPIVERQRQPPLEPVDEARHGLRELHS